MKKKSSHSLSLNLFDEKKINEWARTTAKINVILFFYFCLSLNCSCWTRRFNCRCDRHTRSMKMNALPTCFFFLPNTCFFCSNTLRLTITKHRLNELNKKLDFIAYRSMYCKSRIYAIQAASSPNGCTTGVNIVQLIVGLLAFVDRTKESKKNIHEFNCWNYQKYIYQADTKIWQQEWETI